MARIITEAVADPAGDLSAAPPSPSECVLGFFTFRASEYNYHPGDIVSVRGGPMRPDRVWLTKAGNPHLPTTFLVVECPVETHHNVAWAFRREFRQQYKRVIPWGEMYIRASSRWRRRRW
mmetsp:Transcript_29608/g.45708  ORF Transcript_29608/g.45708 Transcript_29608/m.45708 type:complete len:120 (-) Transcript_29608:8-367(-)